MKAKDLLQKQIFRLAKIYLSKPITVENIPFHNRVVKLQCSKIKEKQEVNKQLKINKYVSKI
jgi:hypothetical protein